MSILTWCATCMILTEWLHIGAGLYCCEVCKRKKRITVTVEHAAD